MVKAILEKYLKKNKIKAIIMENKNPFDYK
jgi:hypothetical protein